MSSRQAYGQSARKLVLAFDVGTTYSGISYSILDPGHRISIKGVTRFPAQEHIMGASKIPTIMYYDKQGKVRAAGAEAIREGIEEEAEDGGWIKAEWFKLHLSSKVTNMRDITRRIPALPPKKTVVHIFADFFLYLFDCASAYIQDTEPNGQVMWNSLKPSIDFVLSHPNGWEGREQSQMRQAAVLAGLIPDTTAGHARISFVTEGEASLHFAIESGALTSVVKGHGVVIVDAGGGTIDISTYRHDLSQVTRLFQEVAAPRCFLYGSVFVSIQARIFLEKFLEDSEFIEDLDHIIQCFDRTTKLRFKQPDEPQYIKFGSSRDNDQEHNIRFGQLKLAGKDVMDFFRPSATCIVDIVIAEEQLQHIVLVGGFAANDWLFEEVRTKVNQLGLTISRPENHVNKAVSDGAISFYLNHFVRTRMSRFAFGSFGAVIFDSRNEGHLKRARNKTRYPSGATVLPNHFTMILPKNTQVSEVTEFKEEFYEEHPNLASFRHIESEVWCYRGELENPEWKDEDPVNYHLLCTISADLSHLPIQRQYRNGKTYYRVDLELILRFGLTEMQAQIAWKGKSGMQRTPARIVYPPSDD
ncbi:hypothetical protein NLJ89_g11141 [Agrocybe chaxingu]|uniref:Heat shock 70 kDa protein 12A n=1 Tax=Agrocybe chaxingu TaxID=84603 RepID=A0A9W8MQ91_9AGAR|nr:hypothetical protein NLJ89_g11141 [Agrocybe chaxingu]